MHVSLLRDFSGWTDEQTDGQTRRFSDACFQDAYFPDTFTHDAYTHDVCMHDACTLYDPLSMTLDLDACVYDPRP